MRPQSVMQREAGSEAPCCLAGGGGGSGGLEDWTTIGLEAGRKGRGGWLQDTDRAPIAFLGKQLDELQHRHVKRVEQEREGGGEEGGGGGGWICTVLVR